MLRMQRIRTNCKKADFQVTSIYQLDRLARLLQAGSEMKEYCVRAAERDQLSAHF